MSFVVVVDLDGDQDDLRAFLKRLGDDELDVNCLACTDEQARDVRQAVGW